MLVVASFEDDSHVIWLPLRASLAALRYTANTAISYSVREFKFCRTTEFSLLPTTICTARQQRFVTPSTAVWRMIMKNKTKSLNSVQEHGKVQHMIFIVLG